MTFSVWMATKVQDFNCFSRIFDQNSFLFRDHPKIYANSRPLLLKSWQVTICGAFVIWGWNLLDNLEAHKHFYLKRIPKLRYPLSEASNWKVWTWFFSNFSYFWKSRFNLGLVRDLASVASNLVSKNRDFKMTEILNVYTCPIRKSNERSSATDKKL
jgi:hypothetical protein